MSELVHWFKTGERGARAEFTDSDLFTALLLLDKESMGRYKLQTMLALSDSSTKSLLNYCRKKKLLELTANQLGHKLSKEGTLIVRKLEQIILYHGIIDYELFKSNCHYFSVIRKLEIDTGKKPISSWRMRDIAVAYGANAILFLECKNGSIFFPEEDMILGDFYPELESFINHRLEKNLLSNDTFLLIIAGDTVEKARKSTIISSLFIDDSLLMTLRAMI